MPKRQRLNIFLMKPGVAPSDCIQEGVGGTRLQLRPEVGSAEGFVVVKNAAAHEPAWLGLVRECAREAIPKLVSQSASGVVALQINERTFAIVFGFARHWLDDTKIVRRFGMITTLNCVAPDSIRGIDKEEFDTVQKKTRSQSSNRSTIENFGINVQRDLVRAVSGTPLDGEFGSSVTGNDSLTLNTEVDAHNLAALCAKALDFYGQTTYRERYGWIDNFMRVSDAQMIEQLDEMLIEAINSRNTEEVFLSPPDTLDTQEHIGFKYPRQRTDPFPELRVDDFIAQIGGREISVDMLHKWKIREFTTSARHEARSFSLYRAILFEKQINGKLYALTGGEWFEIEVSHVQMVLDEIRAIPADPIPTLINANSGERERAYNERVSRASAGNLALLDGKLVMYGGGFSRIEVCDLLCLSRNFIHVKAKSKSSTLSHLFAQGLVSAQAFRDPSFRQDARDECVASHRDVFERYTTPADYKVTYAIISTAPGDIRDALPFFSKQTLANAARELRLMGYVTNIVKISVN